ncbi:MAG: hypothetical protein DHS20C18_53620 [Saprospiraceae bacterium]|nr:MAG: hypothetical protein DHS20C18_53620 [Saprospiraceae bacterium]
MSNKNPEEERYDQQLRSLWLHVFELVMNMSWLVLALVFVMLLYGLFGDSLKTMWTSAPVPVIEHRQRANLATVQDDDDRIVDGIHLLSGLKVDKHWELVRGTCTACHSAKMITQSRATREGWEQMIRWMQKTQGLWDLGPNEGPILDYLSANYAPEETGRRANIDVEAIEWYILELE